VRVTPAAPSVAEFLNVTTNVLINVRPSIFRVRYTDEFCTPTNPIQWLKPPASAASIEPYRQYLQLQFKKVDSTNGR
jgi:hypothetical protein